MESIIDDNEDFEKDNKKYNNENNFSVIIELNKTCFFKGEILKGIINLKPKDVVKKSLLLCPISANATLIEIQNYKNTTEENILFKYPMNIPKFEGKDIIDGMKIPFEFQIPLNSYPSLIFDNNTYVRHILIFDFSSIEVKKSVVLIIKNEQYFSLVNELYKSPVEKTHKTTKHKYAIFYVGDISGTVKLEKNAFSYEEAIPIQIDIDCSTLTIRIKKVHISIFIIMSKNNKLNHKQVESKSEKNIFTKTISLLNQRDQYHIEDLIQLPKGNPGQIYQKLDSDKKKYSEKYSDIFIYPSCFGGLLSCEYYLKVLFETDTLFSTNEFIIIPLDFYEKNGKNEVKNTNTSVQPISVEEGIFSTPKPMNNCILYDNIPLNRSKTQNNDKENNNILLNNDNISQNNNNSFTLFNNDINEQKGKEKNNNNSININQEIVTAEKDESEGFEAPPSIINNNIINDK